MSQKPRRNHTGLKVVLILLILVMIAATGFVIWLCIDLVNVTPAPSTPQGPAQIYNPQAVGTTPEVITPSETTLPPETTVPPEPETVIATATVSVQGDLLMHEPVFNSARQSDGTYNFESVFRYSKDLLTSVDYAIANLETTFGGPSHPHVANQSFSCPDALAANAAEFGYDMFITANNHSGDSMGDGLIRTLEVTREAGLATLGSQMPGEKRYSIVEINGIKIGMVAYTWAYSGDGSKFSLNGLNPIKDEGQMNYFTKANPGKLYSEAAQIMEEMKADGAETTMMIIHWGEEYQITENKAQNQIAQKLCDIGFDVIVGGHAHVVQPMELLESTLDPNHKTVCIYSLGNAVSNQRSGISKLFPTGYTEDGLFFTVSFEKYSDGKVYVSGVDAIPTWVNMHSANGRKEYNILPLQDSRRDQWRDLFGLNDTSLGSCEKSYIRTMDIIGEGLEQCRAYLEQAKQDRDAMYLDMAMHPDKYATGASGETLAPAA